MLGRADLHADQQQGIEHIQANARCAAWMPVGAGKTVTTLTALDELSLVEEDIWPALVLGPLRVARSVWPRESAEWTHLQHLTVSTVTGSPDERKAALRPGAHIYSMNDDNLVWLVETLGDDWPFKTVVWDEFTRGKSFRLRQGSKRCKALGSVAHTKVKRFIGLTGTPAPNGLKDLWGQTWFLDQGERLGRTYSSFEDRWFKKGWDGYSIEPLPHAEREIHERLRDICLTIEPPAVDEPIVNNILVDLPPTARRLYDQMEKEMFAEIEGIGVEAFNAAAKTSKIEQIANGVLIHDTESGAWKAVHDAKLEALQSVVEESNGAPILVSYQFRADLARLLKAFPKAKALDADPKTIDRWNAGGYGLLLAHPASAGHGLQLARGGNILVRFGYDWNLEFFDQILGRIGPRRQKQAGLNRPVFDHRIVARRTVDELKLLRVADKRSVQDTLMSAMRARKG